MKNMKKMMALVIAMVMIVSTMGLPAFAAGETNNLSVDGTISVSGLEAGDKVDFIPVLVFDQDATSTGGWKAAPGFDDATTGLTVAEIQKMLGLDSTGKPAADRETNPNNYGISETLAAKIADLAEARTAATGYKDIEATGSGDSKTASKSTPDAGLYIALITPGQAGTVYNPVFVGADYDQSSTPDTSSIWTVDMEDTYSPASMAKKSHITVDKTAKDSKTNDTNDSETVAVGDTLTFTVKTTIPEFADSYTSAVFNVTDELTSGLKLDKTSIHVYEATVSGGTYTKGDEIGKSSGTTKTFTIPEATLTDTGYKVVFDTAFLLGLNEAQPIIIEYNATVQDTALTSVNVEDNTVTINYSNKPTDETGNGVLKDETKHYTFDIDANLLGTENDTNPWKTVEVVKVGLDKDGKEITAETVTWHEGEATQPKIGALEGATFKLYVADANGTANLTYDGGTVKGTPYTNGIYTTTPEIVSDSTGRLTVKDAATPGIRGLDAGVYYLVEETAPAGYIKYQDAVKIEIKTVMEEVTYSDETDTSITWKVQELKSYSIEINGVETANYTFTNESDANDKTLSDDDDAPNKGDTVVGSDGYIGATGAGTNAASGKITNTQGVELPSTGGIGTTIFYVLGTILVLCAGVVLVTRRRMNA
jgi:fimbrial isopeptide formation D2 family protein/LPXTG-motif cell wall-anchored protein